MGTFCAAVGGGLDINRRRAAQDFKASGRYGHVGGIGRTGDDLAVGAVADAHVFWIDNGRKCDCAAVTVSGDVHGLTTYVGRNHEPGAIYAITTIYKIYLPALI